MTKVKQTLKPDEAQPASDTPPRTNPVLRFFRSLVFPFLLLIGSAIVTAALPFIDGSDIAFAVFRTREAEREPDPAVLDAIRTELDLPDGPIDGIVSWFTGALRGDFGVSWIDPSQKAADIALSGFGISFTIALTSTITAVLIAVLLVLPRISAVVNGKKSRTSHILGMAILGSIPEFVLAVTLLVLVAVQWKLLPTSGFSSPRHMVLPVLSLALPSAGLLGRILLITIDGVGQEEWVRAWRLNGVAKRRISWALLYRSMAVLLPQIVLFFAGTLAATALVETTFNIPGLGLTAVDAARSRNIPVLQVIVLTAVVIGLLTGIVSQMLRRTLLAPLLNSATSYSSQSLSPQQKPRGGWVLVIVLVPFVVLFITSLLVPGPTIDSGHKFLPPSAMHPLGTDQVGRDLAIRIASGVVVSLGIAVVVTIVCAIIGCILGLAGPWVSKLGDALNALPAVFIGVILAGVFGSSQTTAAIAVMCVGWIPLAAHTATVVEEAKTTGFYRWAELQGASQRRLLWIHTWPTLWPAVTRHAASRIAHNALALVSLGFLGLGAAHDSPNWGKILSESIHYVGRAPWMMIAPTVLLVLLGVASALATDTNLDLRKTRR
ncbi:MAG: ABC transporter permease subunit [Corynebacterium sp.]|nr:ABC transporter permease subunit [Corynebacterium sp.]